MVAVRSLVSRQTVRYFSSSRLDNNFNPAQAAVINSAISDGLKRVTDHADSKLQALTSEIYKSVEVTEIGLKHKLELLDLEKFKIFPEMDSQYRNILRKAEREMLVESSKLHQEYYETVAAIEATKLECMKYAVGTASVGALVFAFICMTM